MGSLPRLSNTIMKVFLMLAVFMVTHGHSYGHGFRSHRIAWEEAFSNASLVPDKLPTTPPALIKMFWRSSGVKVRPGTLALTSHMMDRPEVYYPTEPDTLYTIIMADNGKLDAAGNQPEGITYFHWIVENVPGTLVEDGKPLHPYVTLVYKQPGRISMTKRQSGCNPNIVFNRLGFQAEIATEYGLEGPIAGNFLRQVYDKSTDSLLCRVTRCIGKPFPAPLAGVNDGPLCQA